MSFRNVARSTSYLVKSSWKETGLWTSLVLLPSCIALNETAVGTSETRIPPSNDVVDTIIAGASASGGSCSLESLTDTASGAEILSGKDALNASGVRIAGAMTNYGTYNLASALPTPGYISGFSGLATSEYCSTKTLLGSVGTATCVTGSPNATDADVASGKTYWNAGGGVSTGSATLASPDATADKSTISFSTGSFASVITVSFSGTGVSSGTFTLGGSNASAFKLYAATNSILERSTGVVRYSITSSETAKIVVAWDGSYSSTLSASLSHMGSSGATTSISIAATANATVLRNWYRADAITGLAANADVTSWADQVGGYNLTASGSPKYMVGFANGYPAIKFTSGPYFYKNSVVAPVIPYSAAIVYFSQDDYGNMLVFTDGGSNFENFHSCVGCLGLYNQYSGVTTSQYPAISATNMNLTYYEMTGTNTASGTFAKIYNNGNTSGSTVTINGTRTANTSMTQMSVGMLLGSWGSLDGYIAEIVIFSSALTSTQRTEMQCMFAAKYNLNNVVSTCP